MKYPQNGQRDRGDDDEASTFRYHMSDLVQALPPTFAPVVFGAPKLESFLELQPIQIPSDWVGTASIPEAP